ncbi:hypothetical protein RJT34_15715 [Clitoria ternatea]|uniref:Transmembrane protein n=1 Tax=Clitoria ternatea TaxID=43366 RepID=A0AAN9J5Y2_CLITE
MGSLKGGESGEYKKRQGLAKPYNLIICIMSLLISIGGGCLLGWWLHKYHPTNRQLWMVPFGLIVFLTPLIVCFSLFFSDLCVSDINEEEDGFKMINQRIHPLMNDSHCERER